MSYNGKRIKVHHPYGIGGLKKGDIITVETDSDSSCRGRILTVNGKPYKDVSPTNHNMSWGFPVPGHTDWDIISDDEPSVGSIVILAIGSSHYIGKYKCVAAHGESKYELDDWIGLQYLHIADTFNNGGRFSKFVRYATLFETEQYFKIGKSTESEENTTTFRNSEGTLIKNGDIVKYNDVQGQIYIAKNEKERLIAGSYTKEGKGNIAWILDVQGANNCPTCHGSKAYIIQTYEMDKLKLIAPLGCKEEYVPKLGDIVVLSASAVDGALYIGEYRYTLSFCITCNPWTKYKEEGIDKSVQLTDGGFHKIERKATNMEIDKFRALVSLAKMKKEKVEKEITSFTNHKGQLIKNGDYIQCVGGKGKIYIAKNAEERALYDHHNESLPVFWVLGISGLDNCPTFQGPSWIVNDNEVTLIDVDYEEEYNPCKEIKLPETKIPYPSFMDYVEGIEPKYIGGIDPYIMDYPARLDMKDLRPKPQIKHQNPIILRKTKKKRNLVIITK